MKQIFTLLTLVVLFTTKTAAQSQHFNTEGIITTLQANCWNFYGFSESTTSPIGGARHLYVIPTTSTDNSPQSNSNVGQIATPYLNFTNGGTIVFSYRLSSQLSTNAKRYITVRLFNGTTSQTVQTITLDRLTPVANQTVAAIVVAPNNGIKRLIFDFTGDGDGNTGMYFDELVINGAPYAYNSTNCAPTSSSGGALPIKLLSFSGNVVNKKAELKWAVAENETGSYFEIQKSINGKDFNNAGSVFTSDKVGTESYIFTDIASLNQAAFYRIRVVNKDNSVSYSKAVYLKPDGSSSSAAITILQNPVRSTLAFNFQSDVSGQATVHVYNTLGAKQLSFSVTVSKGTNSFVQQLSNDVVTGNYVLEVVSSASRVTSKFIKL